MANDELSIPLPSDQELHRIKALLSEIGGPNVIWGAQQVLDVLVIEHRLRTDQRASTRLTRATWALVAVTAALCLVTLGLLLATLRFNQQL
jgi:hypothetical protein